MFMCGNQAYSLMSVVVRVPLLQATRNGIHLGLRLRNCHLWLESPDHAQVSQAALRRHPGTAVWRGHVQADGRPQIHRVGPDWKLKPGGRHTNYTEDLIVERDVSP